MRVLGYVFKTENIPGILKENMLLLLSINNIIQEHPYLSVSILILYFLRKQVRRFFDILLDKFELNIK